MSEQLQAAARAAAARLTDARQTVAVAESSSGGLISAALLARPGVIPTSTCSSRPAETTAAATTGPASGPRPASSTPATRPP